MSIISSILNGAKSQEAAEEYRKAAQGMPLVGRAKLLHMRTDPRSCILSLDGLFDKKSPLNVGGTGFLPVHQKGWIDYWNTIRDGRVMASLKDYFAYFKIIKNLYETGLPEQKAEAEDYLNNLRDEWPLRTITSTRICWDDDGLPNTLHHYGCNKKELIEESGSIIIPEYNHADGITIETACNRELGGHFLSYLTGINDKEEVTSLLEFMSGLNKSQITIATPNLTEREMLPERAVSLGYCSAVPFSFQINCCLQTDLKHLGYSRGCAYEHQSTLNGAKSTEAAQKNHETAKRVRLIPL